MLLNSNMGFGFTSGINKFKICVTQGTDATWYGTDGVFGSITPDATITNQTFYSLAWKADGSFYMGFGAAGNEQVPDVPDIKMYSKLQTAPLILAWNETTSRYEDTDSALATLLISAYVLGEKACFNGELLPVQLISYDFNLETVV